MVTYYLVSVFVRLFQYFHLGALATDKQYLLPQPKEVVCRRLSVYCVIKERICRFYPYFWSADSQEIH